MRAPRRHHRPHYYRLRAGAASCRRILAEIRQIVPDLAAIEDRLQGSITVGALRGLLLESDMLTAISAHQLRHEIRDGSLVALDFPLDDTLRAIGLSQRANALPSPGAKALMDEIRAVIACSADYRRSACGLRR